MSLTKNIKLLTWFNFWSDFLPYAPIAILYFTKVAHSYALGISIFSIVMLTSAFFDLPTGVISDILGRKNTLVIGTFSMMLAVVFYATGINYFFLVIGGCFEGLSRALYNGNNDALLYESLASDGMEEEYHVHYGKTSSMFQFAGAFAAIIGGFLGNWSFSLLMWISVLPQLLALLFAMQLYQPPLRQSKQHAFALLKNATSSFIKNKNLRLLSVASVLSYGMGEVSYQFQAAFYVTLWPVWAIGIAKTMSSIIAGASFYFSGQLIKKFGATSQLLASNIYGRIANITAVVFPTIFSPILMASTSLFFGSATVAKNMLMQKEFTDEQRATMSSLNSFAGSIFFAVFAFLVGFVADKVGTAQTFLYINFCFFVVLWLYWKLFKNEHTAKAS